MIAKDPWTDPDPQPGDFDADLERMDPRAVRVVEAGSEPTIVARVERGPDGEPRYTPCTSARAIRSRGNARQLTEREWQDFLAEYGPHMLDPPA
jgi:hypothetical protein